MRTLVLILLQVFLLISFFGCSDSPTVLETGTVQGFVYIHYSEQAIVGTTVQCAGRTSVTDQNGKYIFEEVPKGTIELSFSAEGYNAQTYTVELDDFLTQNIKLVPLNTISRLSGYIMHRVLDETIPFAGITIGDSAITTNHLGYFEFAEMPHGLYPIAITHSQYNTGLTNISLYLDEHEFDHYLTKDDSLTVAIAVDTHYHNEHPDSLDSNFSDRQLVYIDNLPPDGDDATDIDQCRRIGLIQAPEISLPAGYEWAELKRVELMVRLQNASPVDNCDLTMSADFKIQEIGESWWEGTVNNSYPPALGTQVAAYTGDDAIPLTRNVPVWFSFDITEQTNSGNNYGYAFVPFEAPCNRFCFVSSENLERVSERPYIKVVYSY